MLPVVTYVLELLCRWKVMLLLLLLGTGLLGESLLLASTFDNVIYRGHLLLFARSRDLSRLSKCAAFGFDLF
jgi:hypothetical protein